MNWYFIYSEDFYGISFADSPHEAIKEIRGKGIYKGALPLKDFYLYKAFLDFDKQFHCGVPDMEDQDDRHNFYTFCAGHFHGIPDISIKIKENF